MHHDDVHVHEDILSSPVLCITVTYFQAVSIIKLNDEINSQPGV